MLLSEIGTSVCNQSLNRSFVFTGVALPVCARCTGIYLGLFLSYIYFFVSKKRLANELPDKKIIYIFALSILFMGIDVGTQVIEIRMSNNYIRLFTGLFIGCALASFLYPKTNYFLWKAKEKIKIFKSYKDVTIFLVFIFIFYFPIAEKLDACYWPAAIGAALGIIILYFNVCFLSLIIIFKKENRAERFKDLLPFIPGTIVLSGAVLYLLRLYHLWLK